MKSLGTFLVAAFWCCLLSVAHAEPVDINSADAESLAAAITGIGPERAKAIVAFRDTNGPFSSVEDLVLVKGIGSATLEKNRANLKALKP